MKPEDLRKRFQQEDPIKEEVQVAGLPWGRLEPLVEELEAAEMMMGAGRAGNRTFRMSKDDVTLEQLQEAAETAHARGVQVGWEEEAHGWNIAVKLLLKKEEAAPRSPRPRKGRERAVDELEQRVHAYMVLNAVPGEAAPYTVRMADAGTLASVVTRLERRGYRVESTTKDGDQVCVQIRRPR